MNSNRNSYAKRTALATKAVKSSPSVVSQSPTPAQKPTSNEPSDQTPRSSRYKHIKSKICTRPCVTKNQEPVNDESDVQETQSANDILVLLRTRARGEPPLKVTNPLFHKRTKAEDDAIMTPAFVRETKKTGILNLSGKGLVSVPNKVFHINENDKGDVNDLDLLIANHESSWWNQIMLYDLNLSNNMLYLLSPDIQNLSCLTTLNLSNNALLTIPPEIHQLEKLVRLDLSHNSLIDLPKTLFTLPNLKYFNLSHNGFKELDPDISDLHLLVFLDLSHNDIRFLPNGIGFLVRLIEFLISHNHIEQLPLDLVNMRALEKLDVAFNELKEIPPDIGCLHKLQYLYMNNNKIINMPDFEGCVDLREIYLNDNQVFHIPKEFCSKLPHLRKLDVHSNRLTLLPSELALLLNLEYLDLSNNNINNLPCSLSTLAHLVTLKIDGNPIKSIRRDIIQCGTQHILKTLRYRYETEGAESLSENSSTTNMGADGLDRSPRPSPGNKSEESVFPDKYKMRKTRCLTVTMQNLTEVAENIFIDARDENVNIVDFSKNFLSHLPPGLSHMAGCVTELIFANNRLVEIAPFLGVFERLTLLNLSCNQLKTLPKEMSILGTLRELNLSNNLLEEIPRCVYEMRSLEILLVRGNRIDKIDATEEGLGGLKRLATLNLSNNNITYVPPLLGNLTNLTSLEIIGNPFRQPRYQILIKGTDSILSYLRNRIPTAP